MGTYKKYSKELMDEIERQLLGPYDEDWFDMDGILNNTDKHIAKRLDLDVYSVAMVTSKICKERQARIIAEYEIYDCKDCRNTINGCKKHKNHFKQLLKQ